MGTCYGMPQKELDEHIASKLLIDRLTHDHRVSFGQDNAINERQSALDH